jgi:hypothetical protein
MTKQRFTALSERRAHVRYPHAVRSACRPLGREGWVPWTARIEDLSQAGVALSAEREIRPGAVLVVALEGLGGRFSRPLLVRVMHARRKADGKWQIGCAFVKPLCDSDFQQLLLAPQAEEEDLA